MPSKNKRSNTKLRRAATRVAGLVRPTRLRAAKARKPQARRTVASARRSPLALVTAPSIMGMVAPRSTFGFAGPAQSIADQDSGGSLRIRGTDLYSNPIVTATTGQGGFFTSAIGPFWSPISPATISTRVQAIEEMFQWYVIRHLKITYIPEVPTTTLGSLALGYSTDWDLQTAIATPTQTQALELNPAAMTPLWQQTALEIKNTGTKLYECFLSSESGENRFQGLLGAVQTSSGLSTNSTLGNLYVEYVIDFYQPTPLLSAVDRLARDKRRSAGLKIVKPVGRVTPVTSDSKEVKADEEVDDIEEIPSAYAKGVKCYPPSAAPGGSCYVPSSPSPVKVPSRK